jgi:hypothetical protein
MTEEHAPYDDQEQDTGISFAAFVLSLAHTAAVHFGDIPDPVSGQSVAPNLPAAQQMIDILALLETKTRGNLTAEERQLLDQILYELRLRYVEVRTKGGETQVPPSGSRTESGIIIP